MIAQQALSQTKQDLLLALLKNREAEAAAAPTTPSNIVEIRRGAQGGRSFFFFPATDGGVSYFRHLAPHLPEDVTFYGCQAPGFDGERAPIRSVEEIAAHNLRAIKAIQPRGPYYIGGFCMGSLPSYELACQLQEAGDEVAMLLQVMPVFLRPWRALPGADALQLRAIEDHLFIFERLLGIQVTLPLDRIRALPEAERYRFATEFVRDAGYLKGPAEERMFLHRMKMYEAGLTAMLGYEPSRRLRGAFDVLVVGKPDRGEIELDLCTSYTVHLRGLPQEQLRYASLNADTAAMFSGSDPDVGLIGRRIGSYLR
jgi:thioesterase domain-containing protein